MLIKNKAVPLTPPHGQTGLYSIYIYFFLTCIDKLLSFAHKINLWFATFAVQVFDSQCSCNASIKDPPHMHLQYNVFPQDIDLKKKPTTWHHSPECVNGWILQSNQANSPRNTSKLSHRACRSNSCRTSFCCGE